MIVAEFDVWDPASEAQTTLYVSTRAWTSTPTDTPANTSFLERLLEAPTFRQDMFGAALTSGRSRSGIGSALLNNTDHGIDSWLDYYWDGRECRFYQGTSADAYPGSWTLIFKGRMLPPDAEHSTIRINLRDAQQRLEVPFQTTRYAGDNSLPNGLEGVAGDLQGKPKPVCMGEVLNVSPPCVNTSKLIYQVHDGAVQSIAVYDSGLALESGDTLVWSEITGPFETNVIGATYDSVREQFVITGKTTASGNGFATSPDGTKWTLRTSPVSGATWVAVEMDETDGTFIAVGYDDAGDPLIATSPDGIVWTEQTSAAPAGDYHRGVCVGPGEGATGGSRWLVVGLDAHVSTSDDGGETWTTRSLPGTWPGVDDVLVCAYGGGTFIVGGSNNRIATSPDGITWTERSAPGAWSAGGIVRSLAYSPSLSRWFAGGDNGDAATSDDSGATWTDRTVGTTKAVRAVWVTDLALFMLHGVSSASDQPADFETSPDGITWTDNSTGMPDGFLASGQPRIAYHETNGSIICVGVSWSGTAGIIAKAVPLGRTYTSEAELLDNSLAPAAGGYGVYLAGGYFRLGSTPAGTVTADVVQGATDADKTAGQLFVDVAGRAGLTAGDWSAADITALDAANSAVLGYWSGLSEVQCGAVADRLLNSIGGWWGADELGVLRVGVLQDPTVGTPSYSWTTRDIDATETGTTLRRIRPTDANQGVPYYEVVLGYAQNWTVQESGVVGAVDQARRERLARRYLEATFSDSDVQTEHPLSNVLRRDTLMADADAASAEAERLHTLLRYPAESYEFSRAYDPANAVRIGNVVRMTNDYYGLTSPGKRFVVIKADIRPTALPPTQVLTLWRPASTTRATPAGVATTSVTANVLRGGVAAPAGIATVSASGVAVDATSSEASAAGTATVSASCAVMTFWGWDGVTPSPAATLDVDFFARAGGARFTPGAGTYVVTHLTINWDTATSADARLALYTNTSLTINGATLQYDHGKETSLSSGFQIYPVSGRLVITHNDYVFVACKTQTATTLRIESHSTVAADIDERYGDADSAVDADDDVAWDSTAPTWTGAETAKGIAVGFYYVPA